MAEGGQAMAVDWEATLRKWVRPSSDNEETKRDRTEEEVRSAIRASSRLKDINFKVYTKGSYANRTNVRLDYDVDIAVECTDFVYVDSSGAAADVIKAAEEARVPYSKDYGPSDFKDDVNHALVSAFGSSAVKRGNMAIRVRESQTTLPADVVPCFEYHRIYGRSYYGELLYHQGTRIYPERGAYIHNWPRQQYENGVVKNNATGRHYKRMVRALKRLETYLVANVGLAELPSFFMECLVYNVPNNLLENASYVADMRGVLAHVFNATRGDERCKEWLEANERKFLFHASQPWSRAQAHELASKAWDAMGLS